jgi:hypothetical protein
MRGGSLPGDLLRALVGRDVRGEVGPYPARRVLRDPPSAPFSRLLPLRACISLLSVCPSLSLFCARRAPAKMLRNAEISKNLSKAPLRANCCRGVGAFLCMVLGSDSGESLCAKRTLIKLYIPPLFYHRALDLSALLGFGRRLARIAYSSAWHPYWALCPTFTGLARTGGRRAADGEGCARAVDGG